MKDCCSSPTSDEVGPTCSSRSVLEPASAPAEAGCCAGPSPCASKPSFVTTAPIVPAHTHFAGDDCCSAKGDEIAALVEPVAVAAEKVGEVADIVGRMVLVLDDDDAVRSVTAEELREVRDQVFNA